MVTVTFGRQRWQDHNDGEAPPFRLTVRRTDVADVVAVAGDLDVSTSPRLRRAITEVLRGDPRAMCIDLAHVPFVDSSGIGVLAGGYKRALAQGCEFVLRSPNRAVGRVLALTKLLDYIPVQNST